MHQATTTLREVLMTAAESVEHQRQIHRHNPENGVPGLQRIVVSVVDYLGYWKHATAAERSAADAHARMRDLVSDFCRTVPHAEPAAHPIAPEHLYPHLTKSLRRMADYADTIGAQPC